MALLQLKHKKLKIGISGILTRNKAKRLRRKKLIETNDVLKYKCSQIPNVMYLEPESRLVKQDSELYIDYIIKKNFTL